MARTILASPTQEVVIGFDEPFVMIGERINPTGRKLFSKELKEGNYWRVKNCLLYTSPSPRDLSTSRMPSSA